MVIYLARTQGFCSGVAKAIQIVNHALEKYGAPLYVFHEIVHNTFIVNQFRQKGVIFVEKIEDVPQGKPLVLSAHGVPPDIYQQAQERRIETIDATCPLVRKVHKEAKRFSDLNIPIVLIGHRKHQEIMGTSGYIKRELLHIIEKKAEVAGLPIDVGQEVAYLTQTTLSVDDTREIVEALKLRFPKLAAPQQADICFATQRRQDAIKELARHVEMIIICGSPTSSNSNRLFETAVRQGLPGVIIDSAEELDMKLLDGKERVGISSGASVPQSIVEELVAKIKGFYPQATIRTFQKEE